MKSAQPPDSKKRQKTLPFFISAGKQRKKLHAQNGIQNAEKAQNGQHRRHRGRTSSIRKRSTVIFTAVILGKTGLHILDVGDHSVQKKGIGLHTAINMKRNS